MTSRARCRPTSSAAPSAKPEHKGIHLEDVESTRLRSDLEEDFLALCHRYRFPRPETNVKLGRCEVDRIAADVAAALAI